MDRRSFLSVLPGTLALAAAQTPGGSDESAMNRPKAPGTLALRARSRVEQPAGSHRIQSAERSLRWEVAQTAIIIYDMWDTHTCNMSAQRVQALAPRMNQVVTSARSLGVMIIHSPSDTMSYYEGTPQRRRMQRAPKAASSTPIVHRCGRDAEEERIFPIDDTAGGCDDPRPKPETGPPYPWKHENSAIDIVGFDGVSEDGQEIYNYCKQEGITNIALMGVHTNICILNRSFGIRQMTRLGLNVVLVRDLTDTMYDPRARPYVSHARGTELVIEHIELHWSPSILSEDLTRVIPGTDNPASESMRARRGA